MLINFSFHPFVLICSTRGLKESKEKIDMGPGFLAVIGEMKTTQAQLAFNKQMLEGALEEIQKLMSSLKYDEVCDQVSQIKDLLSTTVYKYMRGVYHEAHEANDNTFAIIEAFNKMSPNVEMITIEVKKISDNNIENTKKVNEIIIVIKEINDQIKLLKNDINNMKNQIDIIPQINSNQQSGTNISSSMHADIVTLKNTINDLNKTISDLSNKINQIQTNINNSSNNNKQTPNEIIEIKNKIQDVENKFNTKLQNIENQVNDINTSIKSLIDLVKNDINKQNIDHEKRTKNIEEKAKNIENRAKNIEEKAKNIENKSKKNIEKSKIDFIPPKPINTGAKHEKK